MQENISEERIEELINRIDSFMEKGGSRLNVKGGEGDPDETRYTQCCGEFSDPSINAPVKE